MSALSTQQTIETRLKERLAPIHLEVIDDSPKAVKEGGLIALQLHTGLAMTIQFKDIKIKLLPATKAS